MSRSQRGRLNVLALRATVRGMGEAGSHEGAVDRGQLSAAVGEILRQAAHLSPLAEPKDVVDATRKYLVDEPDGRPQRVVLCSVPAGPDMVFRAMAVARKVAQAVGPRLARSVLLPVAEGRVDGCSFAVVPYYSTLSERRPLRWMQRAYYGPLVLAWLRDACARTARAIADDDMAAKVVDPMEAMLGRPGLDGDLVQDLQLALDGLADGNWRPVHVMCHGDMWRGNVMIDQGTRFGERFGRFVIIDWPGATMDGFAFYDFTRLAQSFGMSRPLLRRALQQHCQAIHCERGQAAFHLLAALAKLGTHLEQWPEHLYVQLANQCHAMLKAVTPYQ
jgi:hypothetical protein